MKNPAGEAHEQVPVRADTQRPPPPRCSLTRHMAGRSPGRSGALGGDRASASRGRVRSQVRASARAAAPRQRPAQSSGSSWRTGRPSAALGAPPPAAVAAAAAPAARASRVRAPHPARRVPQVVAAGRSAPGAPTAGRTPAPAAEARGPVRRWGGAERGGGHRGEATALTPTPRHHPECCRLPAGVRPSRSSKKA